MDTTMSPSRKPGISGEVTRIPAVEYLQGMTGHAVGSLIALLLGSAGYWVTGEVVFVFGGLVCGFLLTANGLSIYLWESVQEYVRSRETGSDADTEARTLAPPALSSEHKSELTAGFVQVVGLVVAVSTAVVVTQRLGVERGSYLLGGLLAVGNVGVLVIRWANG
jgi:hypothetical protein